MNNMEYKELTDAMVKHQLKNEFLLTLELIKLKAHHLYDIKHTYNDNDAREEYLYGELFNRSIDLEDDALLVWFKVIFGNALPYEYSDFKMNSIDYRGKFNNCLDELMTWKPTGQHIGLWTLPEKYFGCYGQNGNNYICPINFILKRCYEARASTLIKLSYDNYSHHAFNPDGYGIDHSCPIGKNRRYEVLFIRYILYLYMNEVDLDGNISVYSTINNRRYICEHNKIKQMLRYNNHNCPQLTNYNNIQNTGLKPITDTGFKRLCVDRELHFYWKAGPIHQPCNPVN